jgi:hypothetical protein
MHSPEAATIPLRMPWSLETLKTRDARPGQVSKVSSPGAVAVDLGVDLGRGRPCMSQDDLGSLDPEPLEELM